MLNQTNNKKRYIVIGNGQGWCPYGWKSMEGRDDFQFFNEIIPIKAPRFVKKLCLKHFSFYRPYLSALPLRRVWYRKLYEALHIEQNTDNIIIFYDWGPLAKDLNFVRYIKKRCNKTTLVYMFSNVIKISGAVYKYGTFNDLPNVFDKIYAFDKEDAKKYHFDFSPLMYTRSPYYQDQKKIYDVFYVGNAKDRLDELHQIYQKCIDSNLSCLFYINNVPASLQKYQDIHYNELLSYEEVLNYIAQSKCMVDAIQGGSTAMTIKVCESVIYDIKLITTNTYVQQEPYYNESRFLLFNENNSNLKQFVDSEIIPYTTEEKSIFSPEALLSKIVNQDNNA